MITNRKSLRTWQVMVMLYDYYKVYFRNLPGNAKALIDKGVGLNNR
jgi:hypothetical protein